MEKGQGNGTDTLQTANVYTRKEYIEREAVIDALQNHYEVRNAVQNGIMDECVMLMMQVPAADVVPARHGRWKWELADNGWANHICSQCGYTKNTDVHVRMDYDYCPNCGAIMDGDGDA